MDAGDQTGLIEEIVKNCLKSKILLFDIGCNVKVQHNEIFQDNLY